MEFLARACPPKSTFRAQNPRPQDVAAPGAHASRRHRRVTREDLSYNLAPPDRPDRPAHAAAGRESKPARLAPRRSPLTQRPFIRPTALRETSRDARQAPRTAQGVERASLRQDVEGEAGLAEGRGADERPRARETWRLGRRDLDAARMSKRVSRSDAGPERSDAARETWTLEGVTPAPDPSSHPPPSETPRCSRHSRDSPASRTSPPSRTRSCGSRP